MAVTELYDVVVVGAGAGEWILKQTGCTFLLFSWLAGCYANCTTTSLPQDLDLGKERQFRWTYL